MQRTAHIRDADSEILQCSGYKAAVDRVLTESFFNLALQFAFRYGKSRSSTTSFLFPKHL